MCFRLLENRFLLAVFEGSIFSIVVRFTKSVDYFVSGVGSLLAWSAEGRPRYLCRTDAEAMLEDWVSVGEDVFMVFERMSTKSSSFLRSTEGGR